MKINKMAPLYNLFVDCLIKII